MGANLGNCPDCGREISLEAKSCPHCGLAKPFAPPISEITVVKPEVSGEGLRVFAKTFFYFVLISGALAVIFTLVTGVVWGLLLYIPLCVILGIIVGGVRTFVHWIRGGPEPSTREVKVFALKSVVIITLVFIADCVFE